MQGFFLLNCWGTEALLRAGSLKLRYITGTYLRVYVFTYLLNLWSRVLLEKLTVLQLAKKIPSFYVTRMFITAFTNARLLSLSWPSSIHSVFQHLISWQSSLILSSHLPLCISSCLFPSDFSTKNHHYRYGLLITLPKIFKTWKDPVPIVQEAGWAPGRSGRVEKSRPHRDSIRGPSSP
jgi:hypothetical protein